MPDTTEATIAFIRAAAGDLAAWDAQDHGDARRAAALLTLDPDSPPLALFAALARIGKDAPAALLQCAQRAARSLADGDAPFLQRMPAARAADLPETARQALLAAVARDPDAITTVTTRAWDNLDAARRAALIAAALPHADSAFSHAALACASALLTRLGAAGLATLDEQQRRTLIQSAARDDAAAARAIAALGMEGRAALDAEQRAALVQSVAEWAWFAARAIEGLGAAGLAFLDENLRAALIQSAARSPATAAATIEGLGGRRSPRWTTRVAPRSSSLPPAMRMPPPR